MKTINIIGAGLIGLERIKAVAKLRARGYPINMGWVHDPFNPRLTALAAEYGFDIEPDCERFYNLPSDLVIVACPHDAAVKHTCNALYANKLVLIEKPLGRNLDEMQKIAEAARNSKGLYIGLNYRFMPGIAAIISDWQMKKFGTPISLRLQIGHGGKPGDEKTWKLDPIRCGGGALLDPGIHMLDILSLMLDSAPELKMRLSWQGFWSTGIDEDTQLFFKCNDVNISLEVSVVRWRSHFEIFALGTDGYGQVTGRGRSYGPQRYLRGPRWGWQTAKNQAASEELILESDCEDSFAEEIASCLGFETSIKLTPANLQDGIKAMNLYHAANKFPRFNTSL
jgi:predicted dehydrogenase